MTFLKLFNYRGIDYSETTNFDIDKIFDLIDIHYESEFARCIQIYENYDLNEMFFELSNLCLLHEHELYKKFSDYYPKFPEKHLFAIRNVIFERNMVLRKKRSELYIKMTEA